MQQIAKCATDLYQLLLWPMILWVANSIAVYLFFFASLVMRSARLLLRAEPA